MSISIGSYYGNSPSAENNAKYVKVGDVTFYFSYETLVAVGDRFETKVIENNWGPTTGKHLNSIDTGSKEAKSKRLTSEEFDEYIESMDVVIHEPVV